MKTPAPNSALAPRAFHVYLFQGKARGANPQTLTVIPIVPSMYTRYWFEFEDMQIPGERSLKNVFGVTAVDINDALQIIQSKAFRNQTLPSIVTQIENVDVRDLDQNHVIPNMLSPNSRGIWFPMGFSQ